MKALNLVRNTCAHHGRLFNRVHTLSPKLPKVGVNPDLDAVSTDWSRTFGQLTLIQFLLDRLGLGRTTLLPAVMKSYPTVRAVPITHMGAPTDWQSASASGPARRERGGLTNGACRTSQNRSRAAS
ncbi:hypothetical protein [Serinicoccus sp. CUA-874]|uniref:hypothetical protein n=1 Tax=Serinicoccus sp. CUA-874 TaxID=1517939 RepID=UPI001ED9F7FD|nr:hypothetical protein [Serinicoccus sp. CUA-874]